jgi:glutamate dehydrogenase (NAD(P)+)
VPGEYVLGLDVGLNERDAAIVQDELGDRGAMMGAPAALGGLPYDELGVTGFGVAEVADELSESLRGKRVAIQGFGAVGAAAAKRFADLGALVVAVSSVHGALHDPDGLDVPRLLALRETLGDAAVGEYGRVLPLGKELLAPCDVLVPAATQDVIDKDWAGRINAGMVVEGANLPTTAAAQEVLAARGITVVPDFIANAGGIIAAAFGMDARYSPFPVAPSTVMTTVSSKLRANAVLVVRESARLGVTTHDAARALAQDRVLAAMRLKGQVT